MEHTQKKKRSKLKLILKIVGIVLAAIIILPVIALFTARGINYLRFSLPGGVREKIYVKLGGVEQFINIRGKNTDNPVIIWLHGGPGSPDTYFTTTFQLKLEADYTFIRWDQRGCGRTYYKSKDAPLSFDILLNDLDNLVDYAAERFHQPIIIVGHSWGTILGIEYAANHPDKIAGYVGVGQFVNSDESDRLAAETSEKLARKAGNEKDAEEIETLYQAGSKAHIGDENFDEKSFFKFRALSTGYLNPNGKSATMTALLSPDFGWNDLRWELLIMTNMKEFNAVQKPLYPVLYNFTLPERLDVPAVFIQGSNDYICATELVEEYQKRLTAPSSDIFVIPGVGHMSMMDDPAAFGETLKNALDSVK